jgi:hypothetical protein
MIDGDGAYKDLANAHRKALEEFNAIADEIAAVLATGVAPRAAQFAAEELARRKLFEVRRKILELRHRANEASPPPMFRRRALDDFETGGE